ncbi:MAG TPA: hypothetical protein PKE64_00835 [Anaerolineae bacterium]|nr:hypothetical protein [Anaerolineae bacterium]
MPTRNVLIIFLDGVGLGPAEAESNPFMHVSLGRLGEWLGVSRLTGEEIGATTDRTAVIGLDARLEVAGLPQSATGQTTILTGLNAAQRLGEHYGPYPNQILREMLAMHSVFQTLVERGLPVAFANAYPERFLSRLSRGKGRLSANTQAAVRAGIPLRGWQELQAGQAIGAFLSNEYWPEPGVSLPPLSPYQAGQQLAGLAQAYVLTFFEFWYSDWVGHKSDPVEAKLTIQRLDAFMSGVLDSIDFGQTLVLVVSDHGNLEDWTTKKHTLHPALGLVAAATARTIAGQLTSLLDIKPAILTYLAAEEPAGLR